MTAKLAPAFITGGSSGIGFELARMLAARGHPLALFARDAERLEEARSRLCREWPGVGVTIYPVDVADEKQSLAAFTDALATVGPPAWAIASAGIAEPGLFLEQPLERMNAQMDANFGGSLRLARVVAPAMARAGGGRIVFIASAAALVGIYGYAGYGASKFAVRGLAETLRVELASSGIRVTLACPPDTDTPQLEAESRLKPAVTRAITRRGGLLGAEVVARAILRAADADRFLVASGLRMTGLGYFSSLIAPILRAWQVGIARRHGRAR